MLTIYGHLELLALNRALMEVRFLAGDVDDAVRGSSHLAEVHVQLVDALINFHHERGETREAESWNEWRSFEGRGLERQGIIEYLIPFWAALSSKQLKLEALKNQMRPFTYEQEELDNLYRELDVRSVG
jgi:hypothetical protein